MTAWMTFRFEYRFARRAHGRLISAWLALRAVREPLVF